MGQSMSSQPRKMHFLLLDAKSLQTPFCAGRRQHALVDIKITMSVECAALGNYIILRDEANAVV